jgi:glycosyltransferase involved in cell wall biosynthesis
MIIKDIKIRSKRKMKKETNHKIDVIIPAYKAHDTILRTLSSIIAQTILEDLTITIVNDCCPDGSYKKFKPYIDIKEIKLKKKVARQKGIDEASNVPNY